MRITATITCGVVIVAALAGPFGTTALPLPTRFLLWASLIVWNVMKWQVWQTQVLARAKGRTRQLGSLGLGTLLINAPIAWEVETAYAAVGRPVDLPDLTVWLIAVAISLTIGAVIVAITDGSQPSSSAAEPVQAAALQSAPVALPLLRKAAVTDPSQLVAVQAEDHYLRLHLVDGRNRMILYRLGDALAELDGLDGLQVHRSFWVASAAMAGLQRHGRGWRLRLANGMVVPVGGSHLARVRNLGLPVLSATVVTPAGRD